MYSKLLMEDYNQSASIITQGFENLRMSAILTTLQIYVQKKVAGIKLALIDILRNVDIKINAEEEVPVSIAMMANQTRMKRSLMISKQMLKTYRRYKYSEI